MRIPVAKEGLAFILPSLGLAVLLLLVGPRLLALLFFLLFLFFSYFFRNPARRPPAQEGILVSPADGRVTGIEELMEERFLGKRATRISIFMGLSDVHVNRAPCAGEVATVAHEDGRFDLAFKKGVDRDNERNYIGLETSDGRLTIVQIAGFLARRIICYVKEADRVERGGTIGMIAFGSRVDLYIPSAYAPVVQLRDKVKSGVTILARKSAP